MIIIKKIFFVKYNCYLKEKSKLWVITLFFCVYKVGVSRVVFITISAKSKILSCGIYIGVTD